MDISLDKMYEETLRNFPELIDYFPHYDDGYVPPWDFFWNIVQALKPKYVRDLIDACNEKWCGVGEDQDEMEMIEIRTDLLQEIMRTNYYRSKSF